MWKPPHHFSLEMTFGSKQITAEDKSNLELYLLILSGCFWYTNYEPLICSRSLESIRAGKPPADNISTVQAVQK